MVNVPENLRFTTPFWSRCGTLDEEGATATNGRSREGSSSPVGESLRRRDGGPHPPLHYQESRDSLNSRHEHRRSGVVRSMLDGFMASTLLSCVQQPIESCVSGEGADSAEWDYPDERYDSSRGRSRIRRRVSSTSGSSSAVSPVLSPPCVGSTSLYYPDYPPRYVDRDGDPGRSLSPASNHVYSPRVAVKTPGDNDVVCGKGGDRVRHPGNERFRELCRANRSAYSNLTKKQKIAMAREIIEIVQSTNPPGHFLARNPRTGFWEDIGLPRSLEKAAQALRGWAASSDCNGPTVSGRYEETNDEPMTPVPSLVSSSASTVRTPSSSAGRRLPPPQPTVHIPPHLRSVFQPTSSRTHHPPLASLQTPTLMESPKVEPPSRRSVDPNRSHRYPQFQASSHQPGSAAAVISPAMKSVHGRKICNTEVKVDEVRRPLYAAVTTCHRWPIHSPPTSPDAPDDEISAPIGLARSNSTISTARSYSTVSAASGTMEDGELTKVERIIADLNPPWSEDHPDDEDLAQTPLTASSLLSGTRVGGGSGGGHDTPQLFSPSRLLQSRGYPTGRARSLHHPLPFQHRLGSRLDPVHPQQSSSVMHLNHSGYDSDASMDGGTALSTAAFLRLDETDE